MLMPGKDTNGNISEDQESFENGLASLKRRPQRTVAQRGAVSVALGGPASEVASSRTGSESDTIGHQYSKAARTRTTELIENHGEDGDDIDSDRPMKRTRLSLGRALTNAPVIEDDDSDGTPAVEEPEDVGGVTTARGNLTSDDDADTVLTDLDDIDIALLAPSPNRPQASPAKRGVKRQRGGRAKTAGGTTSRGRLPGTPKRGTNRDDSLARGSPAGNEAHGILDRLPGRRRAHHADMDVEVDLRRQLELRIAYRALAKALKPILAELADRTAQELRANEELYKQCPEYQEVMEELEEHLSARLALLQTEHDEEEQRLQRMYGADQQIVHAHYEVIRLLRSMNNMLIVAQQAKVDLRDDSLLDCQYQFLKILHEAGVEQRQADAEAVVGRMRNNSLISSLTIEQAAGSTLQYKLQYSAPRNMKRIDQEQMRRQHLTDTFRNWKNLEDRFEIALAQSEHDPDSYLMLTEEDAITEEDRWEAEERQETATLLQLILDAAAGTKPIHQTLYADIIPNNAAIGLNLLADAMLMTPPGEHTKDVQKQQTAGQLSNSPRAQAQPSAAGAQLSSPSTSKVRSPPITPRSQPFVPTISAIMNDPEPADESKAEAQAVKPAGPPVANTGTHVVEEQRSRKRTATEMGTSTSRTQTPAVTIEPLNAPARQAMATQTSSAPDEKEHQSHTSVTATSEAQAAAEKQKRVRRRPGPRAIYTKQTAPDIVTANQQYWSPFNNSMGPPTYLPKYVRDEDLLRRSSISDVPETAESQDQEPGDVREAVATPLQDPLSVHGMPRGPPSANSTHLTSAPVTSPPVEQQTHYRVNSDREQMERESRRNSSRSVHPEHPPRQHAPTSAPPANPYHWPHQNIYYQPQTFYGPYSPAPGAQHHNAPPALPAQAHAYSQHSGYSAVPRYPPPPAPYQPLVSYSTYPPPTSTSDSMPTKKPRQSSTEHGKDRRQSSNALPSISTIIQPPANHTGPYHYPPAAHAWPHPSDPHRQHGTVHPPYQHAPPNGYYQAYPTQEDAMRRNSHVPLLTPSAKPLPAYVQGSTQGRKPSTKSTPDARSPPVDLRAVPPEHRAQAIEEVRRSSKESAAIVQATPAGRADVHHHPESQSGPSTNPALTTKVPNVRASSTVTAPPQPPAPPPPIQHPNFKGQRPKHHEWRNWTSAVPPPSSGANNPPNTQPVSVMMIGATNSAGPYSSGNRKRRNRGAKAPTPQPVPEAASIAHVPPTAQETPAPPAQSGPKMPNPWHREYRFESQNKKFEGGRE